MSEEIKQDTQQVETETPKPDPTFTQADIDRIVKERLERVKAKYADYDALKTRAAKLDELERAKMDEEDRLAADLKTLEDRAAAAEKARDEVLAQSQERLIRTEVTALAAAMGFKAKAAEFGQHVRDWVGGIWANVKDWWQTGGQQMAEDTLAAICAWFQGV